MATKIERLAPEFTALAAQLGEQIRYSGGSYYLTESGRFLWDSRAWGPPTKDRLQGKLSGFRETVATLLQRRQKGRSKRLEDLLEGFMGAEYRPGHFTEVGNDCWDTLTASLWLGAWSVTARVHGEGLWTVRGASREGAVAALRAEGRE